MTNSKTNSTNILLKANEVFQGISEDITNYLSIRASILSDVDSADEGLIFEWSHDNIVFDFEERFTVLSNSGQMHAFTARAPFLRVTYINGPIDQNYFNLSISYHATLPPHFVQNLDKELLAGRSGQVVKSILAAKHSNNNNNNNIHNYININGSYNNPNGNEFGLFVRNIPSGTQNISGAITLNDGYSNIGSVNQGFGGNNAWKVDGSSVTQPISAVSLPLPSGASTEATLALIKTKTDNIDVPISTRINTLGQKTMSASTPVVLASDQSVIPSSQSGIWTVQQGVPPWKIIGDSFDNSINTIAKLPTLPAIARSLSPSWADGYQVPLSTLLNGQLRTDTTTWFGSNAPTVGQKIMNSSIPVVIASNQSAVLSGGSPDGGVTNLPLKTDINGNLNVIVNSIASNASVGIAAGVLQLGGSSVGTLNAIRATPYIEQNTNAQRSIKSSSINDSATNIGMRKVTITYYNQDGYGPFTEIITLNGTTPVNTINTNICFIEKMVAYEVGSSLRNIGTITLYSGINGTGTVIGTIGVGSLVTAQGDNQTLWAHHYVPYGKTASLATYIMSAESGGSGTNATYFLRSQSIPLTNSAEIIISDLILIIGPLVRQLGIPIKVIGPARITAYGIPGGNNVRLNASFDFSEI